MKYLLLPYIFLITLNIFAQESNEKDLKSYDINQRKGSLFFSVGSEYRIIPLRSSTAESSNLIDTATNIDLQSSGVAFDYAFDYFVSKNLALGFSNSIRYDLINLPTDEITSDFGFRPANNSLIFGFHFYLDYHFKAFKNSEIFLRFGKSLLNRGTEFTEKESFFDSNGNNILSVTGVADTSYEPWNYAIGYKKNKISLIIGAYSSSNTEYFINSARFTVPYIKFKYNLGKL